MRLQVALKANVFTEEFKQLIDRLVTLNHYHNFRSMAACDRQQRMLPILSNIS